MTFTNENASPKNITHHNGKGASLSKDYQDLGKITKTIAHDTAEIVKNTAHQVQDKASQYYDESVQHAKKFGVSVENRIQKHPMQSLLIVAGVGLVLGALWNRK